MGFQFTAHACRHCFGRVMQRGDCFVCAICGAEGKGSPASICGCGIERGGGLSKGIGFRCVANPKPGPNNPAKIVIAFGTDPQAEEGKGA